MNSILLEKMKTVKSLLQYIPNVVLSKYWFRTSVKNGGSFKEVDLVLENDSELDDFLKENHIKMKRKKDSYSFSSC